MSDIRTRLKALLLGDGPPLPSDVLNLFDEAETAAREEGRREGRAEVERLVRLQTRLARAEGFEKAREMAEGVAERCRKERETLSTNEYAATRGEVAQASVIGKMSEAARIRDAIRAMRDGAGHSSDCADASHPPEELCP